MKNASKPGGCDDEANRETDIEKTRFIRIVKDDEGKEILVCVDHIQRIDIERGTPEIPFEKPIYHVYVGNEKIATYNPSAFLEELVRGIYGESMRANQQR